MPGALISMNNSQVVQKEGRFTKNKASERSKSILAEEATHFSDAVDKRIWTKYGHLLRASHTFVPVRT
jgi:malate synthase